MTSTSKKMKTIKSNSRNAARIAEKVIRRSTNKVQAVANKPVAKVKAGGKAALKKAAPKARKQKKKAVGFLASVKEGVQTGIETMGGLVKKVTPNTLLPKSAKSRPK